MSSGYSDEKARVFSKNMSRCCKCLFYLFSFSATGPSVDSKQAPSKDSVSLNKSEDDRSINDTLRHANFQTEKLQEVITSSPTPEELALIHQAFESTPELSALTCASKAALSSRLIRFVAESNQTIVEAGQRGQHFYVLTEGAARLINEKEISCELASGMTVGDLTTAKSDTVIAVTRCVLWGAERTVYQEALNPQVLTRLESTVDFVNCLPLFSSLQQDTKDALAEAMVFEEWSEGQEVIGNRDPTKSLWFVKEGRIHCSGRNQRLSHAEFFSSFPDPSEPVASVTAVEQTTLGRLDVDILQKIIPEDLEKLVKTNALAEAFARSKVLSLLKPVQTQKIMALLKAQTYAPGDTISPADDVSRFVVILKGKVRYGSKSIGRLRCIGETWLTSSKKPRLPYIAVTPVETAECSQNELQTLIQGQLSRLRTLNETCDDLRNVSLFRFLPKAVVKLLAQSSRTKQYINKQVIVQEGTCDKAVFIVKQGTVHIVREGKRLQSLQKLNYFGERSLIAENRRTTSAVASGPVHCWVLSKRRILAAIDSSMTTQLTKRVMLHRDSLELGSLVSLKNLEKGILGKLNICIDRQTEHPYLVKIIKLATVIQQKCFESLKAERDILGQLDHPMLIKLVKVIKDSQRLFFITEYVDGMNLEELGFKGTIAEDNLRFYAACLILILQYLHKKQILYRNLKPATVTIDSEGYPKLLDFSTAKILQGRTYTIIGSPHYMAPEVILGKGYGRTADLWALGVVLFELAYGTVPFGETLTSAPDIYKSIIAAKPPQFKAEEHSPDFQSLVKQLLSGNPHVRCTKTTGSLKKHTWFRYTDWVSTMQNELETKTYQPYFRLPSQASKIKRKSLLRLQRTDTSLDQVVEKCSLSYIPPRAQEWFDNF